MKKRKKGRKLGRDIKRRKALFKNLVTALIFEGKIKTTEAKAKAVRGLMDKLVTKAKRGSLAARRQVLAFLPKKKAVEKLFKEIAPKFKKRSSGFTRIIKIGRRKGDNAPMAVMEWTEAKGLLRGGEAKTSTPRTVARSEKKKHGKNKTNKV